MKFNRYTLLAVTHDIVAAALAWILAYSLRFNFEIPPSFQEELHQTLPWIILLQALIFWSFGLYRGIWRYASVADLRRIFIAVITAAAMIPAILWLFRINAVVPRSVLIIDPILLLLAMGGSRLIYRMWKENRLYGDFHFQGEPLLILGAGDAAVSLSKELQLSATWHPVGFLDDEPSQHGLSLNGIKVLGPVSALSEWAERLNVSQAVVAMPAASHKNRKRAIELANQAGIKVLTVPSFDDLLSGQVSISQLRAVELDDLLGRDPVQLDEAGLLQLFSGKRILITGAGGSIGSELCQQIARFTPESLVLFEANEFALYQIEQKLSANFPRLAITCLAGNIRDLPRLEEVFSTFKPSLVFHAAAYKHVPLMEHHNAWEAVRNNVYGTWCVATTAQKFHADKFILISTDKAVNPTNIMGATKRLAEKVCQSLQREAGTQFITVRFGNVLGSTGSVIPKFREQIAKGGPVTVTHPDITRYFMSIPEATQLVMQAAAMGHGGEIFVLDMGEPVKILDLAHDMIRLSGLSLDEIRIEFTGLRPGEKLYEELLADTEHTLSTPHPKIRIAQAEAAAQSLAPDVLAGIENSSLQSAQQVRNFLAQWVTEFRTPIN